MRLSRVSLLSTFLIKSRGHTICSLMLLLLTSCSTVTLIKSADESIATPKSEKVHRFFFGGLVGYAVIEVDRVCGEKIVEKVDLRYRFEDVAIAVVTLGVYTPRTSRVWCRAGSSPVSSAQGGAQ